MSKTALIEALQKFDTPFHLVLDKGYDLEIFKLLPKHGANPDVPGENGRTVREIASRKRDKRYFTVQFQKT